MLVLKQQRQTQAEHEELAQMTNGYVGADIAMLVKEAKSNAIRRGFGAVKNSSDSSSTLVLEDFYVARLFSSRISRFCTKCYIVL